MGWGYVSWGWESGQPCGIPTAAVSAVSRFKSMGQHAKDKACLYFVRDEVKLPDDGLVNIQTAHTGLFLSVGGIDGSDGSVVGLRSDRVADESQWLLVKTPTQGMAPLDPLGLAWV